MIRVLAWPAFHTRNGNPYNWLLYSQVKKFDLHVEDFSPVELFRNRYDIWHFHWPEHFLNKDGVAVAAMKIHALAGMMRWARARGTKMIWTVHNLRSHEQLHSALEPYFWRVFTQMLDGYICFTDSGKDAARQVFPALRSIPGFVIPHGHYREEYPGNIGKDAAKATLGLPVDSKVILFFGGIRPYKNVPALISAFRDLQGHNVALCIAGYAPCDALCAVIKNEARCDTRVKLFLAWASKPQVQALFGAADLVVLPFREILNSGTAMLALSLNRPVLVPARGAMPELRERVGPEWVRTYATDINTAKLRDGLAWAQSTPRSEVAPLAPFDWTEIARQTTAAYTHLLQNHCSHELNRTRPAV